MFSFAQASVRCTSGEKDTWSRASVCSWFRVPCPCLCHDFSFSCLPVSLGSEDVRNVKRGSWQSAAFSVVTPAAHKEAAPVSTERPILCHWSVMRSVWCGENVFGNFYAKLTESFYINWIYQELWASILYLVYFTFLVIFRSFASVMTWNFFFLFLKNLVLHQWFEQLSWNPPAPWRYSAVRRESGAMFCVAA